MKKDIISNEFDHWCWLLNALLQFYKDDDPLLYLECMRFIVMKV